MYFDTHAIAASLPTKQPLVIAIDGGSGSGKSTLGQELSETLQAPLLSLDEYFVAVSDAELDQRSPVRNFFDAFDRKAIAKALAEQRASCKLLVVEGVYSFRLEWSQFMDFRIWIEMPPKMRLERMKVRQENSESQMRLWQATEDWYIKEFNPLKKADLVVDGSTGRIA